MSSSNQDITDFRNFNIFSLFRNQRELLEALPFLIIEAIISSRPYIQEQTSKRANIPKRKRNC